MEIPVLNPALASSALSAFRAHPESGQMTVPFFSAGRTGGDVAIVPRQLAVPHLSAATLGFLALGPATLQPEEPWQREIFSTANRLHFSNPEDGGGVQIEFGTMLSRNLSGRERGLTVSVRRFGDFGGHAMTLAFDPTEKKPSLTRYYDLEFTESALLGLRSLLGWEETLPIYDLTLRLFHHLHLQGDVHPRNPYEGLQDRSLQNEWSGTAADGSFVTLIGGLDDAMSEAYGDIVERLRIEVTTADDSPALSAPLMSLWIFADQVAEDSNVRMRTEDVQADRKTYQDWVRRIYGSDSIEPASRPKS